MISIASGGSLETIGKPNTFAIEVLEEGGLTKEGMVMVGDNPQTDIKFAHNTGIDSVLVLSGATTLQEAEKSQVKPTYILPTLGTFSHEWDHNIIIVNNKCKTLWGGK